MIECLAINQRPMNRNRIGKFEATSELIMGDWEGAKVLMRELVIVKCDFHPDTGTFQYVAFCSLFDDIPPHSEAPWYTFIFHRRENGVTSIQSAVRLDAEHVYGRIVPPAARLRRIRPIEQA